MKLDDFGAEGPTFHAMSVNLTPEQRKTLIPVIESYIISELRELRERLKITRKYREDFEEYSNGWNACADELNAQIDKELKELQ